jgi:hypothetical protein
MEVPLFTYSGTVTVPDTHNPVWATSRALSVLGYANGRIWFGYCVSTTNVVRDHTMVYDIETEREIGLD